MNFCGRAWFQEVFLFFRKTLFYFLFSCPLVWWCPLPILPNTCNVPSLKTFWLFPDLAVLFLTFFSQLTFQHGTFSVSNPIFIFWLYILIVCIRVSSSLFWANILILSMYLRWLIFTCDFVNLRMLLFEYLSGSRKFSPSSPIQLC